LLIFNRDKIQKEIDEWWLYYQTHTGSPEEIKADLVNRIQRAIDIEGEHCGEKIGTSLS
jgi:hypothetical protein